MEHYGYNGQAPSKSWGFFTGWLEAKEDDSVLQVKTFYYTNLVIEYKRELCPPFSWAAEEYGLEGSYEFVSEKLSKIMARSVGLVNTDICVSGPIVKPQASPVLKDVVKAALQHASVPTPESPRSQRSYYDFWYEWYNQVS